MDNNSSLLFEDLINDPTVQCKRRIEDNNNEYCDKYPHDSISAQVEEIIGELEVPSTTELEAELKRKEKELHLCSQLGLYLLQEVNDLSAQKHELIRDHTKVLLDLQSYHYEASKDSVMFDVDNVSEYPDIDESPEITQLKHKFEITTANASNHLSRLESLQNEVFSFDPISMWPTSPLPFPKDGITSENRSKVSKAKPTMKGFRKLLKKRKKSDNGSRIEEMRHGKDPIRRSSSVESLTDVQSIPESTITSVSVSKNLQSNLDKLQIAHERITRLELHLDSARAKYRTLMTEYSQKLKELSRNLGSCVEKARPYFETVAKSRKAQAETQQAAMQYKRACNLQKVARDMVKVAEERLCSSTDRFDTTWQEMLNQATIKVNDASREKDRIHTVHLEAAKAFKEAEEKREKLQQEHQRNIVKSKPYYEVQQDFQVKLETITKRLNLLEVRLLEAKQRYSSALTDISKTGNDEESIALRSLAERGMGVGAENPMLDKMLQENERRECLKLNISKDKTISESENSVHSQSLEHEHSNSHTHTVDELNDDVLKSKRYNYNPYDLMYLKDIGSDVESNNGVVDEYIQDF